MELLFEVLSPASNRKLYLTALHFAWKKGYHNEYWCGIAFLCLRNGLLCRFKSASGVLEA